MVKATLRPKKINLMSRLRESPVNAVKSRRRLGFLIPIAAVLAFLLVLQCAYLFIFQKGLMDEIGRLEAYLTEPEVMEKYRQATFAEAELRAFAGKKDELEAFFGELDAAPELDLALLDEIYGAARAGDVTVLRFSYQRDSGEVTVSGECESARGVSNYSERLLVNPRISSVVHSGYTSANRGSGMVYTFDVTLVLQIVEGK